jgi:uncharacterized protein YndB with AHSA1/START domain
MTNNLIAKAQVEIDARIPQVWDALVTPEAIKQYMFGTNVESEWKEGAPITWKGEWEGRPYEDKGTILKFQPGRELQYTHFSPLSGQPDTPDNYHTVTITLEPDDGTSTVVTLTQDNNATEEERRHSEQNWGMMLTSLKDYLEKQS